MEQHGTIPDLRVVAGLPEPERVDQLRRQYEEVLSLDADERPVRMDALVKAEYAVSDEELLKIAAARLRAWLAMNPESAQQIVQTYEKTMQAMPGTLAMRRVQAVQTIALTMESEELERLKGLIPSVLKQIPSLANVRYSASTSRATSVAVEGRPVKPARRAWEFWKRD